jgi:hypothetical protein
MPSPLDVLPTELYLHVFSFLRHDDLANLVRVSHRYQTVIEPMLWTRIEFHRQSFHVDYAHKELKEEERALHRPYQTHPGTIFDHGNSELAQWYFHRQMDNDRNEKMKSFLNLFDPRNVDTSDSVRIEYLAGQIKWLCLPVVCVDTDEEIDERWNWWNVLSRFRNIEYLEISADWTDPDDWTAPHPVVPFQAPQWTMEKLHTLKIRGHVPIEFVQWACRSAPTIKELQLGLLDAPVGSSLYPTRSNPPPSLPSIPSEYEGMTEEEMNDLDDVENLQDAEETAPRALATLTEAITMQFTNLERLNFIRPAEARDPDADSFRETFVSIKSEMNILNEWAMILKATRNTLRDIMLEQRPFAVESEAESTSNKEFMQYYCHGPGYQRFLQVVLPVLLEDADWPALRSIRLFGFEYHDKIHHGNGTGNIGESSLPGVDLVRQLKERFPEVSVQSGTGRRMLFVPQTGEVESGGDVLDCQNSFEYEDMFDMEGGKEQKQLNEELRKAIVQYDSYDNQQTSTAL